MSDQTRDLFDELLDIARTVVCVADEGPDSARELGLCGGSPLVAACRSAVHRINAEAATVNPRAELSILRERAAADAQTIATLQDEAAGRLREIGELRALLASAGAIAERKGEGTAWARFAASVKSLGISPVTARTYRRLDGDGEPESPTVASLRDENARLKAKRHDWRCTCPSCMPLAVPGPQPSDDDIDKLEGVAWDANVDKALIWYRDTIEMLRQRLRETERAAQIDAKARHAELATLKADADRREREAEALRKASISFLDRYVALVNSGDFGNWNPEDEPQVQALRKALTQRQEQSKP